MTPLATTSESIAGPAGQKGAAAVVSSDRDAGSSLIPTPAEIYARSIRFYLAPILSLLDDPSVSEILVNGPRQVYCERAGRLEPTECRFDDPALLEAAARNIGDFVGRTLDEGAHSMDARLPDGSRVHVIIPPCSAKQGVCLSIRKFQKSSFDLVKLVAKGSLTEEAAEFLRIAVLLHRNTVIAGGTGTGKTSLLNAMSAAIPDRERIVVIEDTSELQLSQPHTVYLEAQPADGRGRGGVSIRDLFVDSLRMRPDRVVVGEVRRGEALDLIQSMLSGHAGSLSTVHANTPLDALIRLETLSQMSDLALPAHIARMQVAAAIHLVVQLRRFPDGSRRVTSIAESRGLAADGRYVVEELYRYFGEGRDAAGKYLGKLMRAGAKPSFSAEIKAMGLLGDCTLTRDLFEES